VEVRNWLVAGLEQVLTYPHPAVKLLNGTTPAVATYLHRDGLSSVRAITDAAGVKGESAVYKPFGEQSEWVLPGNAAPETKGWIGERFDADAGLQYLNARTYDPELSLFLQPDWFEVTKAGVGTNRFSYSFNDPVNKRDPNGNQAVEKEKRGFLGGLRDFFSGFARGAAKNADLDKIAKYAAIGAAGGAVYGGVVGVGAGCAASACAGSVVTGPAGAGSGFLSGGFFGGLLGGITDMSEVVAGGIQGGIDGVQGTSDEGTRVLASPNPEDGAKLLERLLGMASTGAGIHGNNLMSPKPTELYNLVRTSNPSIIDKIGITSAPGGGPTGRYSQAELTRMGVDYVSVETFDNRLSARIAEVAANLGYVAAHGTFPKYTFRY